MTQALITLGLGSFGSPGQVVLVGLYPSPPPDGEPISWIGFTATGAIQSAAATCAAAESTGSGVVAYATATGRPTE